jgi:hypothetical protein
MLKPMFAVPAMVRWATRIREQHKTKKDGEAHHGDQHPVRSPHFQHAQKCGNSHQAEYQHSDNWNESFPLPSM